MSLLFPVLTIFLIIFLSLFLIILHFLSLIVPQSLSPLRAPHMMLRIHLSPGPRLLLTTSIITVSVLRVTCLWFPVSYLLVVLHIVCSSFLAILQQASTQCLPHTRKRKSCVPDWNVSANKLKQSAIFWNCVWLHCGSPSSGVVYQIKRNADTSS